jgi:hypothetical protein
MDGLTLVQRIRGIFAQAPIFSDVVIAEPLVGPSGEVAVDVSFGHGPTVFRVVGPSEDEAYAILHELASAMVEIDKSHRALC